MPGLASAECTVHGNVYDWSTFSTINNAVVEVSSVPAQTKVTTDGSYTFSLLRGNYTLTARAGVPGTSSEVVAVENITVPDSGDYVIDLILFPPSTFDDLEGFDDENATPTMPPDISGEDPPKQQAWILYLGGAAIVLALIAIAVGFILLRMLKRPLPPEEPEDSNPGPVKTVLEMPASLQPADTAEPVKEDAKPPAPSPPGVQELLLPQDCREVLGIIEKNGGRITQLDLRKALPYSEAKVSLIVSDLESRGILKKVKKGRGNVLIINRPDERPPEK